MGFYERLVLPHLLALAMQHRELVPFRQRAARAAEGRVLEIGIGSGLNLPFYGPGVREVVGLDSSSALLGKARKRRPAGGAPLTLLEGTGEALPLDDRSMDTVVTTWTLCSVGDPLRTLREARRVLRPGGRLVFVEHGRAPDPRVQAWQDRLTPCWRPIAGGCHLNRKMDDLVRAAGFALERLDTGYARGPRIVTFMYEGQARPL